MTPTVLPLRRLFLAWMLCFYGVIQSVFVPTTAVAQGLTVKTNREGVLVREGTDSVLFYQKKTKSKQGEAPRANYIHPLYDLDGAVLTEDFPEDPPHHHWHQRGVFWAWHQVLVDGQAMGDMWDCKDFVWDVHALNTQQHQDGSLSLLASTYWTSPRLTDAQEKQEPFVEEKTTIRVHPATADYRVIDFDISLRALLPHVMIGGKDDFKGYGGFSVRMKLPEDLTFVSTDGEVTPTTTMLTAGPWMDISGSLGSNPKEDGLAGIVIMNHPDNPPPVNQWILRKKESMQNPVYPGRQPVPLSDATSTVLRYRLVIYQGDLSEQKIKTMYEQQFD